MTDLGRWSIKAYAGGKHTGAPPLSLILHTRHGSEASRDAEIAAFRARMGRGEVAYIDVFDHETATTERIYS